MYKNGNFIRSLSSGDYTDVEFDEKSGGLKATHKDHNFDKLKGWYEKYVQDAGFKNGHSVTLEKEDHSVFNMRNTEGLWDGMYFEVTAAENGTPNNVRNALKHCAKKGKTEVAVIFYPKEFNNDDFLKVC